MFKEIGIDKQYYWQKYKGKNKDPKLFSRRRVHIKQRNCDF